MTIQTLLLHKTMQFYQKFFISIVLPPVFLNLLIWLALIDDAADLILYAAELYQLLFQRIMYRSAPLLRTAPSSAVLSYY